MPLIRQPGASLAAEPFSLADIAVEAKAILTHARRQAQQIIDQANVDAAAIGERARQAGHDEGFAAGQAEGLKVGRDDAARKCDAQFTRATRALAEACEQLAARKGRMLAEARQDLVALALAAAAKIVRRRLRADPSAAVPTVEAAVELAGRASRLSIRVAPGDLETVQAFAPQLSARLVGQADCQVVPDETVESGGCRIIAWRDTGQPSEIDATIQTQLDRLADELLGQDGKA